MSDDEPTLPDEYKCGCDVVEHDGESDFEEIKAECPEHGEPPDWGEVFE